jgi:hypothetical protein
MSRARDFWLTHAVVLAAFLIGVWIARRSASEPSPSESPVDPQHPPSVSDRDRYLEVHQLASDFMRFEGTLVWDRFSGMVAVHAILIGFYGLALDQGIESPAIGLLIPVVGLGVALAWLWLTRIGVGYHDAWKCAMRRAETELYHCHPAQQILKDVGCDTRRARRPLGEWWRAHKVQYIVIVALVVLYVGLGGWYLFDYSCG